ncbi:MotE family protein [Evansella cellulosilytica]|uniref:MgtE intracellular region n=1 Tax=Evansella cellulosilytica (strain ATCC 21833 / DSM 2522 / FERM P-1141 / JCM 9156 / N-4) TaxID=649639 RepID=E6TSW3_EVAC2|nr:MgtE intracellular region [Evansella cellulosilytica]ADU30755.1 MgtE intracellular region [Evansella cellulosilytica DSM 2522]
MSENHKESKWQYFLMVILIPIIFAIILAGVLLHTTGIMNVGERLQQTVSFLPFIDSEEQVEEGEDEEGFSLEEEIANLEREVSSYASQIYQLELDLEDREAQITLLEDQLSTMEEHGEDVIDEDIVVTDIKEIIRTLEAMSASKAANILSEMTNEEAATYLRMMKVDTKSQIISRLDPADAAEIITILSE